MSKPIHVLPVRRNLSLTREAFAAKYYLPVKTLEAWERPPRRGNGYMMAAAVRNYLHLIMLQPRLIAQMLADDPPPE